MIDSIKLKFMSVHDAIREWLYQLRCDDQKRKKKINVFTVNMVELLFVTIILI